MSESTQEKSATLSFFEEMKRAREKRNYARYCWLYRRVCNR